MVAKVGSIVQNVTFSGSIWPEPPIGLGPYWWLNFCQVFSLFSSKGTLQHHSQPQISTLQMLPFFGSKNLKREWDRQSLESKNETRRAQTVATGLRKKKKKKKKKRIFHHKNGRLGGASEAWFVPKCPQLVGRMWSCVWHALFGSFLSVFPHSSHFLERFSPKKAIFSAFGGQVALSFSCQGLICVPAG